MKKFFSMLLILTLVFSTGVPAYGAETDSRALEKAITAAKNIIEVPEAFNDFNYSTSQSTVNGKVYTFWNLSWNDVANGGSIYVSVDEDGYLTNYYFYDNSPEMNQQGLSKVTKPAGLKSASDFLAKAIPGYGSKMKEIPAMDQTVYGQEYQYFFKLYVNQVPVDFAGAMVAVNRFTGKITSYYYNGVIADLKLTGYPEVTGVVGADVAGKAFLEEIGMDLKYYSYYDYMKRTLKVYPVYETTSYGKAIDAKTGKMVKLFADDYGYYGGGGADGKGEGGMTADSAVPTFTEEELAVIQKTEGLIEKQAAEAIAREFGPDFGTLNSANLESNYVERDKYFWNLNFEKGYASVNAATSELGGFSVYEEYNQASGGITEDKAKLTAEAFLKKVAPAKVDQVRFVPSEATGYESGYYYFNYVRQANGIDFVSNNLNITVNKKTGKITGYYSEWYDSATFPSIEKAITKQVAFGKMADAGEYGLMYKKVSSAEIALVYDFVKGAGILIDGLTGERVNWDGSPYTVGNVYSDIKGNWAEKMILALQENGYYLPGQEGDRFNPKNTTTQIEFLRYLYAPVQAQYSEDESFYFMLVSAGIVKKEEINGASKISRQEAAKFVTRYLGFDKLALKTNIFKNVFKDAPAAGYQGYAAICYGFDIITGDARGYFSGSKTITHAETAKVIYKMLQANQL